MDLNNDKINDTIFVYHENHHKTPYFGQFNGTNQIYVTAKAMKRANTNDHFDYSKLEEDLNKK